MFVAIPTLEPEGPFVNPAKRQASDRAGAVHTIDRTVLHPAVEQPRLDYQSGRQPYVRWGRKRYVRTGMAASDPFQGRWAYVGYLLNKYKDRYRMTVGQGRTGVAFVYPQFGSKPITVTLGKRPSGLKSR